MIVKMDKITMLVSSKAREDALKKLRKFGLVHINFLKKPVAQDISSLEEELDNFIKTIALIGENSVPESDTAPTAASYNEISSYARELVDLDKEKIELNQKLLELNEKYKVYEKWGRFSKSEILKLHKSDIYIKLYSCQKKSFKDIPDDKVIELINEDAANIYFAFVSNNPNDKLPFTELELPDIEQNDLENLLNDAYDRMAAVEKRIKELKNYKQSFIQYKEEVEKKIEFSKVKHSMIGEDGFFYLEGFCPRAQISQLYKIAEDEKWGIISSEPENPDEVPTLLKNPKWLKIINPIYQFMGAFPGYHEFDVSFWFLLFFSLFFAMIIGDGGYGLLLLLINILIHRKMKKSANKDPILLLYVLSVTTVVWGALTGTWFGYKYISELSFFNMFIVENVYSFNEQSTVFIMFLCFIIGGIHLSMAHLTRSFNMINSMKALGEVGWVAIIWTLFYLAGKMILGETFEILGTKIFAGELPSFIMPMFLGGIGFVLVFSNFQKNILKGILISLGDLPLSIISSFSDLVSYIRLFAVGYASVIVSSSFNNMAGLGHINTVVAGIIASLILFFGHGLNIILCLMAVVVHGIRLNMLEFSGHVNMQWSGKEYNPFKE